VWESGYAESLVLGFFMEQMSDLRTLAIIYSDCRWSLSRDISVGFTLVRNTLKALENKYKQVNCEFLPGL